MNRFLSRGAVSGLMLILLAVSIPSFMIGTQLAGNAQSGEGGSLLNAGVGAYGNVTPGFSSVTGDPYPLIPYSGNPVITASMVTDRVASFVADPFLFYKDNVWYMFFEVDSVNSGIAEIGLASSSDGLHWTYQGIVLSSSAGNNWHFAYPYVFSYNGSYYMTPDTYNLDSVRLYQATNFPYGWTLKQVLVQGTEGSGLLDPQPFYYNGMWWMFVGEPTDSICYLYYSASLTGPWVQHPKSPIANGDASKGRGAGRTVLYGGKILRLVESWGKGDGVGAYQVDTLTTTSYAEHEIEASPLLSPSGQGWNRNYMHNLDPWWNGTAWLAVADGCVRTGSTNTWSIGIYTTAAQQPPPQETVTITITYQPFSFIMQYTLNSGANWTAPSTITVSAKTWTFLEWSDGSTEKTRTFMGNGTYQIVYG